MKESTKDEVMGKAHEIKGAVKEAAGKVLGKKQLEAEGQGEKIAGKIQGAVGRVEKAMNK